MPSGNLSFTAVDVFIERDIVSLDQVRPVAADEVRCVFSKVLAGFGDEAAEAGEHIVSHAIPIRHSTIFYHLANERVQIRPLPLKSQVERHMVDSGAQVVDLLKRDADVLG